MCDGEQFGVVHLVAALEQLGLRHRRKLSVEKVHALLYAYAHHLPYPKVTTATDTLSDEEITSTIQQAIQHIARPLSSFLVGTWNVEDAPADTQFDTIYLGGGGAYYFEEIIRTTLSDCHILTVPDPQRANICGYADLAVSLDTDRWEIA